MFEHLSNCHGEWTILCGGVGVLLSGGAVWISMKLREWGQWLRKEPSTDEAESPVEGSRAHASIEAGPSPTFVEGGQELVRWFVERKCCPDCGHTKFIPGPSGGMSQNMLCATCHSEFNLTLPYFADRLGNPDHARLRFYGVKSPLERLAAAAGEEIDE